VYQITAQATDNGNLSAQSTTTILVKNFNATTGKLIAYYPLTGNYEDVSGNRLHGEGLGTVFVPDRNGAPDRACYFNGGVQHISVNSDPKLNFQDAITLSFWFNAARLPEKETFLISHGSWQNRYKISITPEKRVRWTVNTTNTISDLDSPNAFVTDSFFHITAIYDGALMSLYLNGNLIGYKSLSGKIRPTSLPLMLGQMLPTDAAYNFKGIIDEVKIYDYALIPTAVVNLYQQAVTSLKDKFLAENIRLSPNPVADILSVQYSFTPISIEIRDINGRLCLKKAVDTEGGTSLNVSHLIAGVYWLTVRQNDGMKTIRFVKI
jgi:hypothetical protein